MADIVKKKETCGQFDEGIRRRNSAAWRIAHGKKGGYRILVCCITQILEMFFGEFSKKQKILRCNMPIRSIISFVQYFLHPKRKEFPVKKIKIELVIRKQEP